MVLTCPECETRLQLDEAKTPTRPFVVRCPKCQTNVNVQPDGEASTSDQPAAASEAAPRNPVPTFERPATAPRFQPTDSIAGATAEPTSGLNDIAKLLAEALNHS